VTDGRILGIVLAGGEGTRLHPLTAVRSKPAVPFGDRYGSQCRGTSRAMSALAPTASTNTRISTA
jgi:mannose-1-phosphate guanylyltransferase